MYFNRKSKIYNFNSKSSYFNLTYIRLPWHLVENAMGSVDPQYITSIYSQKDS